MSSLGQFLSLLHLPEPENLHTKSNTKIVSISISVQSFPLELWTSFTSQLTQIEREQETKKKFFFHSMLKAFIFTAVLGMAAAECPNACSGHGDCGSFDVSAFELTLATSCYLSTPLPHHILSILNPTDIRQHECLSLLTRTFPTNPVHATHADV